MNLIKRIRLENIKGKSEFEINFDELHANHPNLLVAPNGFGKSTLAVAFESLRPNKIELKHEDLFEKTETNEPLLQVELAGENAGCFTANYSKNEISKNISTYVINSPVYAKSNARHIRGFTSQSAILDVENLILIDKIPEKCEVGYSLSKIKSLFGTKGKIFSNLACVFKDLYNLQTIVDNYELFFKCATQKRPQSTIDFFIEALPKSGSVMHIKSNLSEDQVKNFQSNELLFNASTVVKKLKNLPFENNKVNVILSTIQIVQIFKNPNNHIKKALEYIKYSVNKERIDKFLNLYNTTGRQIKTKESKGKLKLEFLGANMMSNGERDVLSFIANLAKFNLRFTKKIGILIIDEVFDYLDGSNMLIVQYHLEMFIDRYKKNGKILFPIILTHLDPILFRNYYFKKPKINYLKQYAQYQVSEDMLKLLRLRNSQITDRKLKQKIESSFLHYNPSECIFEDEEKKLFSDLTFNKSSSYYAMIIEEINKYLSETQQYDPLKVICAIRVKIEKMIYKNLQHDNEKSEFIDIHTTIKKLVYGEEHGFEAPESFYLLQPLYNDGLHMNENVHDTKNKIISACLKLDNYVVKQIVKNIFE